ncbi:RNA annealing protein [Coniochaeta hoffmannii]|uniref:RNA annealing protein n=1 Tax=Coniochaeta hoffmannii TaxID=91930 RepID=A0AA38S8W9_9PEZI|nr:RNA annealing protein [Coniochaeta hoffmannii]
MSGKLDQSLDEILSTQRKAAGRRSTRRAGGRPAAPAAPAGGIKKNVKPARNAAKPTPAKGSGLVGESKIMVSNMPKDVSEAQIKEYFQTAIGQVKRVELSYGPGGVSRGIAHITFHHADGASKAFQKLNGLLIDNRPVKVEVIVASADLIPQPKSLGQRITQPKAQPKSAATDKHGANAAKAGAAGKPARNKPRRGRNSRPSKKTAEELDSEMADYFVANNNTENGAAPAPGAAPAAATNGDAAMDDDIL